MSGVGVARHPHDLLYPVLSALQQTTGHFHALPDDILVYSAPEAGLKASLELRFAQITHSGREAVGSVVGYIYYNSVVTSCTGEMAGASHQVGAAEAATVASLMEVR